MITDPPPNRHTTPMNANPCLSCGACCAYFRVTFHWLESAAPDGVPADYTETFSRHRLCLKGTNSERPRCSALTGQIGHQVSCAIYPRRPSPCREFALDWREGVLYYDDMDLERCRRARAAFGLAPLLTPAIPAAGEVIAPVLAVANSEAEAPDNIAS